MLRRIKGGHKPRRIGRASPEEARERQRRAQAERLKDPVRRAHRREYDRIYKEAQRRAAGIPARKFGPKSKRRKNVGSGHGDVVEAAPVLAVVGGWLGRDEDRNWTELAVVTKVPERTWLRVRETGRAHISTVDRTLIALDGPPLSVLYPG